MAKGSSQIRRSWLEGVTRCSRCNCPIRSLEQVGHVRTRYPGARREVFCNECRDAMMQESRAALPFSAQAK